MNKLSKTSTLLTCLGAVGVVATAISAIKAAPKAERLLEEARLNKGDKLTKKETVQIAGPVYIPTIITGVSTIACIFGANVLSKKAQASLISAYALLDRSYDEYTNKVKDIYGEDADDTVKAEMLKTKDCPVDLEEGEQLFFDFTTMRYFSAPMEDVIQKVTLEGGNECYIISTPPSFMEM